MNANQLRRVLVSRRIVGDVCPADKLPSRVQRKPSVYIVNTDNSGRPGQHWVLFYFPRRGPAEFFDSLAHTPESYRTRFRNVLIVNAPRYAYNNRQLQDVQSDSCGAFCLYYAIRRWKGASMKKILGSFHHQTLRTNDRLVRRYLQRHTRIAWLNTRSSWQS